MRALAPDGTTAVSQPFAVEPDGVQRQTMSDVLAYFKAMRSSGEIDRKDRTAAFFGDDSGRTVDARGGWLDASGDTSKFLSHLTYTRTMSPQQTPLCAWAMLAARDALAEQHPALTRSLSTRLRDEALWGADFLVRFQDPAGYFYVGIFDALTKQLDERVINAPLPDCVRTDRYQAAYRHGGGLAIAALARASRADDDGDFPRAEYLRAARAASPTWRSTTPTICGTAPRPSSTTTARSWRRSNSSRPRTTPTAPTRWSPPTGALRT
ncbi:glycoside hydrolase family 9 protein [Catenulispora yoronensis]